MGHRKRHALPVEALELVAMRFKALAEPMRLRLLQALEDGEKSVSELATLVGTTAANVSKHLHILHHAGIVARRPKGTTVYYTIEDQTIFELCDLVCASLHERLLAKASVLEIHASDAPTLP